MYLQIKNNEIILLFFIEHFIIKSGSKAHSDKQRRMKMEIATQTVSEIASQIRSIYDDGTFIFVELGDAMIEIERNDIDNPDEVTAEQLAQLILEYY